MMTLGVRRWVIAALVPALFALEGCGSKPGEVEPDPEPEPVLVGSVEIALQWQTATPTPLHFAFYRAGNGALEKEFAGTAEGFKGTLPLGEYNLIAYDKNAQQVGYRNMGTYQAAEVYAQNAAETMKTAESPLITQPGTVHFAGGCVGMTTLTVTADQTLKAKVQPQNRTRSVVLNFELKNGAEITTITGGLDGVSSSVLLSTGKSSGSAARLPFRVNCADDKSFKTSVSLFDFISAEPGDTQVHTMDVTLSEATGATYSIRLDLTETLRDIVLENGGVIPIEIPIEIVIDMTDVDGITASVRPWEPGSGDGEVIR